MAPMGHVQPSSACVAVAVLEKARLSDGLRFKCCNGQRHGLLHGRRLKRSPCFNGVYQVGLQAVTIMQAN